MGFATDIERGEQCAVPAAGARAAVLAKMTAGPVVAEAVHSERIAARVIEALRQEIRQREKQPTTFLEALMRREERAE